MLLLLYVIRPNFTTGRTSQTFAQILFPKFQFFSKLVKFHHSSLSDFTDGGGPFQQFFHPNPWGFIMIQFDFCIFFQIGVEAQPPTRSPENRAAFLTKPMVRGNGRPDFHREPRGPVWSAQGKRYLEAVS